MKRKKLSLFLKDLYQQLRKNEMRTVKRKYIVDEKNRKVAVQLDIKTFNRIEEIMENFALYKLMYENKDEDILGIKSAKKYYSKLKKLN